jgi:hypothetical protein
VAGDAITEGQVFDVVRGAIYGAVRAALTTGYNTPVNKMLERVIARHQDELEAQIDGLLVGALVLDNGLFQQDLQEQFRHKVAKILISKCEGSLEQCVGDVMRDPIRRAKVLMAVQNVIAEGEKS